MKPETQAVIEQFNATIADVAKAKAALTDAERKMFVIRCGTAIVRNVDGRMLPGSIYNADRFERQEDAMAVAAACVDYDGTVGKATLLVDEFDDVLDTLSRMVCDMSNR